MSQAPAQFTPLDGPVRTTCPYCAVQCNFDLHVSGDRVVKVAPTKACPVAKGTVCKKGLAAAADLTQPERLTSPLLRHGGELVPVSWAEAMAYVRDALTPLLAERPSAVGVFGSGSLTNEKAYLLGKFARVALQTPHIDYNGRYCMSSAAAALGRTVGLDRGLGFPLSDIGLSDLILLVGANIAETLPPIMQYLSAAKHRGGIVYAIDPRATTTARVAGHHLAPRPGTDGILALGLLHLMKNMGRILPTAPAHGMVEVLAQADLYPPQRVAHECGIKETELLLLAKRYAEATKPLILTGRGAEQHAHGTDTVQAWLNLSFLSGHFGKAGGGYGTLTGQGNGQGGREHGQKNDQLPGGRSLRDSKHRAEMATFWGVTPESLPQPGHSAQNLLRACGSELEALIVVGSNPVVSAAGAGQITDHLKALKHLIVVDFLPSETARLATLVLPGAMWCEEEGTTTNLEGRVQRRRQALNPPGEAKADWQIICELAWAIGRPHGFTYAHFRDLQEEFFRATKGGKADYSGLSADRLDRASAQWPIKSASAPDTPYAYAPTYPTTDGLATLHLPHFTAPPPSRQLLLTTGRLGNQYQSGTQTRRNAALRAENTVQIHPETAREYGLKEGEIVTIRTSHGETQLPTQFSPNIRPDTLFLPFHWPETANLLTNPELIDPHSHMPSFKVTPVELLRLPAESAAEHRGKRADFPFFAVVPLEK